MSFADEIKFGTDGWRGVISDNFTFKNVEIVAQAISDWVLAVPSPQGHQDFRRVTVGYDTRFLSREYAETVAACLASNGIEVYMSDEYVPTPALSYGAVHFKADAGVMITASHNPAKFNGIKIKTHVGGGASNDITDKVEARLGDTPVKTADFQKLLGSDYLKEYDFKTPYFAFMKQYLDFDRVSSSDFKIIQDVMHGSGRNVLKSVLEGTKIKADCLRNDINPSFGGIGPEPVESRVAELIEAMKTQDYDLGLILDGDADRIAAVAPGGEFINPQKILGMLVLHLHRNRGFKGGIIKTTCGSVIMDRMAEKLGLRLYETPVGFKYISDLMVNEKIITGGEEAGGMGVQGYIPERDGTMVGLLLLEMMVYQKMNILQILQQMEAEFGRYYYLRSAIPLGSSVFDADRVRSHQEVLGMEVKKVQDNDGLKLIFEDNSWLMLRPSGTEPLVRAYAESDALEKTEALLREGEKLLLS